MRLASVAVSTLVVPFRQPFTSGSVTWERRRLTVLSLRTDTDLEGLGEFVAPAPDDLGEDISRDLAAMLEGIDLSDAVSLAGAIRRLDARAFVGRVARGAVESAIVDLFARATRQSVARSLSDRPAADVAVNAVIGILPVAAAASAAADCVARGYRTLKLKAGDEPPDILHDRVSAIRETIGPDIALRVDFNGELPARRAPGVLAVLAPLDLEYVEQPISSTAGVAALARLRGRSDAAIAADESVRDLGSARELIESDAVDAIVLKPARVGGLRQASSIAEMAGAAGIPVTISTLFEAGVGIAGALHLAATIPGTRGHGLATARLLESDLLRRPLPIEDGRMAVPSGPGLGVELDADALDRYRVA